MHWQEMGLSVNWSHASRSYVKIAYSPQLSEKYKQNFKIIIFCSYMYQFLKFNQQEARVFFKTTCMIFSYFRLISINSHREIFLYSCEMQENYKTKKQVQSSMQGYNCFASMHESSFYVEIFLLHEFL